MILPAVVAALALGAPAGAPAKASAPSPCPDATLRPTAANLDKVRAATLCLINRERAKRGIRPLRAQPVLRRVALRYSRAMVRSGFFDHRSPGGSTMVSRVRRTNYLRGAGRWWLGENLAWGTGTHATPEGTVAAWMASPGHRHNILDPSFDEIGIGVAVGAPLRISAANAAATYTTNFGRRD